MEFTVNDRCPRCFAGIIVSRHCQRGPDPVQDRPSSADAAVRARPAEYTVTYVCSHGHAWTDALSLVPAAHVSYVAAR